MALTQEECLVLMAIYQMPPHIVRHSLLVSKVALFLSQRLNALGEELNLSEVEAAALLHDITKKESFRTGEDHAASGERLLRSLGYPTIGEIVGRHIHLRGEMDPHRVTAEEIVNYADKRVRHEQVVTLRERFIDLQERYGKRSPLAASRIRSHEQKMYQLEEKIFCRLGLRPEDLADLLP
ncbi:MAG: HDIG domain-containing protein [Candidatus Tectomicrobia bacterium]|uniref:HDIG domain-containing protein n=1 Tax=Tectimicrobiota bacterium TaxID=2528274 RepID=A0A932FVT7_UNCTE|nr:HDIG domain-containing protein [Candidatus Tectomicrobia bacterium]